MIGRISRVLKGNISGSVFGIHIWIDTVQWDCLLYNIYNKMGIAFIFMYLFIKCVYIVFILSGHTQKKDGFNTKEDEKGKMDNTEIFFYKSVTLLSTMENSDDGVWICLEIVKS